MRDHMRYPEGSVVSNLDRNQSIEGSLFEQPMHDISMFVEINCGFYKLSASYERILELISFPHLMFGRFDVFFPHFLLGIARDIASFL